MKKGGMLSDISETLVELGKSTATQTVKAVAQTINPVKILEKTVTGDTTPPSPEEMKKRQENVPNSSPLDLQDLQKKYDNQDGQKLQMTRQHLFKLVKEGEEKAIYENKQKEEQRKRDELREEEEKKKQKQQAQQQQSGDMPKGKERKSIMGAHKKKADLSHQETKPSVSKG